VQRWQSQLRVVVLLSGGRLSVFALRLDELASVSCLALHLTLRHRASRGLRRPLLGQGEVRREDRSTLVSFRKRACRWRS